MKKWIIPLALLALVLAALPVLALSGSRIDPFGQELRRQPNPSPDTPVSSDGDGQIRTPTPDPNASPPAGLARSLAPIEGVEIVARESFPVQYAARVDYGLPNGCARPGDYQVERNGTQFEISVWILLPSDPNAICTMIYGIAHHDIPLGTEFVAEQTYTLTVNRTTRTTFTAQ